MSIKLKGLDELQRNLKKLERNAKALDGTHEVRLSELFNGSFMRRHTTYGTLDAFIEASGFKVESQEDFEKIPDVDWDAWVARSTKYTNWHAMLEAATAEWAGQKLGLR